MTSKEERVERHPFGGKAIVGLAIAATFVLGGCSSVPDALNPAEWWRSASDAVSGDDQEAKTGSEAKPIPGEKESFPKLGTVPDADAARARRPDARGLVGDTSSRYGEPITRQGAPANPLTAPEPAAASPAQPVPVISASPTSQRPADQVAASRTVEPPRMPEAPAQAAAAPAAPQLASISQPAVAPRPAAQAPAPTAAERSIPPAQPAATPWPVSPPSDATVVVSSEGVSFDQGRGARGPGGIAPTDAPGAIGPSAVRVATIQFGNGSSVIDGSDRSVLRDVAAIVKRQGGKRVTIVGHASSRTRDMTPARHIVVNEEMSVERAHAVAKALADFGVSSDIIQVRAAADQQPVYYEIMPSGEAGNRRTEVYVEF